MKQATGEVRTALSVASACAAIEVFLYGFGDSQVQPPHSATDVEVQISEFVFGMVGAFLRGFGVSAPNSETLAPSKSGDNYFGGWRILQNRFPNSMPNLDVGGFGGSAGPTSTFGNGC